MTIGQILTIHLNRTRRTDSHRGRSCQQRLYFSIPDSKHAVDWRRHLECLTEEWVMSDSAWSSKVLCVSLNLLRANTACMPAPLSPVFHSPLSTSFSAARAPLLFVHTAVQRIQTLPVHCSLSKQIALYCYVPSFFCLYWSPLLPLYWSLLSQCLVSSHT